MTAVHPVRFGLLSTARINAQLLLASRASPDAEIVAVASRDADRAQAYARRYGIDRAHGSYDALLDDAGVDAVYVSLPNSLHAAWAIRALDAGKHVLCEKPLAARACDAEEAAAAADRNGVVLAEAFMYRHHPQLARVTQLVAGGAIGRLAYVHASMSFPLRDPDDPRLRSDLDGGALLDLGCYGVSAARLLAGEPLSMSAVEVCGPTGVDVRFAATLRFSGDVVAHVDCALDQPRRDRLEVVGTDGAIVLGDPWHGREPAFGLRREFVVADVPVMRADPYKLELEAFCEAVRGGRALRWGAADAIAQARTIEALRAAAAGGSAASAAGANASSAAEASASSAVGASTGSAAGASASSAAGASAAPALTDGRRRRSVRAGPEI